LVFVDPAMHGSVRDERRMELPRERCVGV
jgi:hypothetical protein